MNKFKNAESEIMGILHGAYNQELANRENVKELLAELIKDLPPALSKNEKKVISDIDRCQRNAAIKNIKIKLYDIEDEMQCKGLYDRMLYTAGLNNVIPIDNMEDYREGAERQEAINQALQICEDRMFRSKQELRQRKEFLKEMREEFQLGMKQAFAEYSEEYNMMR